MCPLLSEVLVWVDTDRTGVDGPRTSDGISTHCSLLRLLDEHFTALIRSSRRRETMSSRDVNVITLTITESPGRVEILSFFGSDPISKIYDDYSRLTGVPKYQFRL